MRRCPRAPTCARSIACSRAWTAWSAMGCSSTWTPRSCWAARLACACSTVADAPRQSVLSGGRGLVWIATATAFLQIVLGARAAHRSRPGLHRSAALPRSALAHTGPSGGASPHVPSCPRLPGRRAGIPRLPPLLALSRSTDSPAGARPARAGAGQIALGVFTILTFKELIVVTGHLLVGALVLASYVGLLGSTGTRAVPSAA